MSNTTTSVVCLMLSIVTRAVAQEMPDTIRKTIDLHGVVVRDGAKIGPVIWPGFRPDTIPTLYVIANRGKALVQWRHPLPEGFQAVPGDTTSAWSTRQAVTLPSGLFLTFMSMDSSMSTSLVVGTAVHEAFHSFERSMIREGSHFGQGENAMLTGSYPVFDIENETAFALEGATLRQALEADSPDEARQLAREFLGVRQERRSRLTTDIIEFENMAEMNEGLAQYALIRGTELLGKQGEPWRRESQQIGAGESAMLDSLLEVTRHSVRRRFYATGSAMALLLDRLSSETWKVRLMSSAKMIDEVLSEVTDFRPGAETPEWKSRTEHTLQALRPRAEQSVADLRARRISQADSILARTGVRIVLDPEKLGGSFFQWCGFDPQNTLQTGDGRTLHMRFLNVCGGSLTSAEFTRPVVEHDGNGLLETVVDPSTLVLTAGGEIVALEEGVPREVNALRIESSGLTLVAGRALISLEHSVLRIRVR